MKYNQEDVIYVNSLLDRESSKHLKELSKMIKADSTHEELFDHGKKFLPARDERTGRVDLDKLSDYVPEIVGYFNVLAELPSLPKSLKEVATDLAIYANGESVQIDKYYQTLDPDLLIKKALEKSPRP